MKPYYDKGGITIWCGDCLEVMPRLDGSFDAIISDWPYGTTACHWDSVIPLEPLWKECKRLSNLAVLFGSQPFTTDLINSNREWFRYEWIWEKQQGTGYLNANRVPMKSHENVLVFYPRLGTFNPQKEDGEPYRATRGAVGGFVRDKTVGGWQTESDGSRFPKTVLRYNDEKGHHPTQKPEPLLAYLVRTYTNPGDIILDNTVGSGTTLVAAQNEGRRAVGIELDEEYCRVAVDRLRQRSFWSLPADDDAGERQLGLEL